MQHSFHTGTLYSFFHARQGDFFHTTDLRILNEITVTGVLHPGRPVVIGGTEYRVTDIAIQLLAGNPSYPAVQPNRAGDLNRYLIQAEIWVEDVY